MRTHVTNSLSLSDTFYYKLQGSRGITIETDLTPYNTLIDRIYEFDFSSKTDGELQRGAEKIRGRASAPEAAGDELQAEGFALLREVCSRVLRQKPYDTQLIAAIAMHQGKLAQMRTGEGKTLAAVLPAAINAFSGKGVHIMTANDYLAKRDAEWMGPVYTFLGLRSLPLGEASTPEEKYDGYRADITYCTAKQAGFDFLSDCLRNSPRLLVQRRFFMVIVDEADFIMIDEARNPLVIAGETEETDIDPRAIDAAAAALERGADFTVDRRMRNLALTPRGYGRIEARLGIGGVHDPDYTDIYAAVHAALHARYLLAKDVDYIIRDGRVELVDELTGRIADRRRWPWGIQTAVEAKEGLAVRREGKILGSITVQNFITLYPKIAAMTATAVPAAAEFSTFYGLKTVVVPPARPETMTHAPDSVFTTREEKRKAVIREIVSAHRTGRPVLAGTASVRESEELAAELQKHGILPQVLNARNDEREAELIARAGMFGAVTISTNMAGRGTDIRLGGLDGTDRERVLKTGGLYVIGTNRHESVRIDNQLRGRAGRQGDPGLSRFFISLEDEMILRYGILEFIPSRYLKGKVKGKIDDPRVLKEIDRAQAIVDEQHYSMRSTLRRYSRLVEKQRKQCKTTRDAALFQGIYPDDLIKQTGRAASETESNTLEGEHLKRLFLRNIDRMWAGHLAYIEDVREGIYLRRLAGEDPLLFFIRSVSAAYDRALDNAISKTAREFTAGSDAGDEANKAPSATWTYMINDNPFPLFNVGILNHNNIGSAIAAAVAVPLAALLKKVSGARHRD